jgi:hypothetical protein
MARAKKATVPAAPEIRTSGGKPGDVEVRLSFPTVIGVVGADRHPTARLVVTDEASRMTIVEVEIPAAELMQMIAGGGARVSGAYVTSHGARLGKSQQNTSTDLITEYGVDVDAAAAEQEASYLAAGWEVVRIDRTNFGRRVVAYRWVDAGE